jgi:uncharacterized protein (DUF488 family)
MSEIVYTIGHSSHTVEELAALLARHGVTAVGDVRSRPYSRLHPQFNREPFTHELAQRGIGYVFLGAELGARSNDPACYLNGKVQYDRLAATALFQEGLQRIRAGCAKGLCIALLCAEKEPLHCHRSILVARKLEESGTLVRHILEDGSVEEHAETIARLRLELDLASGNLFLSEAEVLAQAYAEQGQKIAYDVRAEWKNNEGEEMSA